jgi:acetyltransferase-like isoleucine patch superfamily enzyme
MKGFARGLLNVLGRAAARPKLAELRVEAGSVVYLWRLRAAVGGRLTVLESSRVETRIAFEREGASLTVGRRSFIGQGHISCSDCIEVGDDVMIAWGASIFDHASHSLRFSERSNDVTSWLAGRKDWTNVESAPVRVHDKAWIGFGSILLPGVSIGEGAVIGAGSVVARDIPAWCVAAGNPARVLRELGEHER